MDFDFKKSRKNKHRQDKTKSTYRPPPEQKAAPGNSDRNKPPGGHATPLRTQEKPVSYTATDPDQFQHLKRETDDIAALTETKSYSRRVVVSNWERYELPPESPDDQKDEAFDFEALINSLSDARGHMKLRHEQDWGSELSELQETFFNIDMLKLSMSLQTIPFHIRQNLPSSLFTAEQLNAFEEESLNQKKMFEVRVADETQTQEAPPVNYTAPLIEEKVCVDIAVMPVVAAKENEEASESSSIKDAIFDSLNSNDELRPVKEERAADLTSPGTIADKKPDLPSANFSKSEELDLDFLLSLESAVPQATTVPPRTEALKVNAAADPKSLTGANKLDDWLDDLLDD